MNKKTYIIKKGETKKINIRTSGEYTFELIGKGAEVQIIGALQIKDGKTVTIRTHQLHKAPNTKSNLLLKSVLFENTKFSYRGTIVIDKKAQGANAYQRNENLLIGQNAIVDTQPDLEIKANEVRCTHGATVGRIDEEQIFYLTSRGLSRKQAEELIIEGFLFPLG